MKKICIVLVLIFGLTINSQVQQLENEGGFLIPENTENTSAFKIGEWLKFRIHYGFLNASYATLQVKSHELDGVPVYHVVGNGKTTGFASIFFKVDDTYESFFDKKDGKPYKFIRKIDEGGYTKDIEVNFDHNKDIAVLNDKKKDKKFNFTIQEGIQDLVSAFYFLRNNYKVEDLIEGESIELDLLYDDDGVFKFKLKYLGKEVLRTKYGKVECLKFRPYVQSGRVFKEQESLSLWVSNDSNRIPIRIQADLSVGSIKADLDGYNGLKHQFKIIMD
ncbi:uncharacterized protein DUF3108 [Arenibacter algicola]|jgi:hypothetical protein|uniref:ATP-dependent exonuclease n=1 Tax=Arenibacter algicola TaxID=616991 RepID=A0A221USZ4_9FLAO|nr:MULTISPECIES: DUF3108 domain-containing protein [Arenibacter]HCO85773.1 DUF3108 domain-containing protein [Arenibacter sp.]ASO04465.1 ATP-dependent exonuclease [Arenibacter algicola]MBD3661618.1 DUF3108 domain-containing protein [Arenibacter algicola]MDX1757995.1 DUF3108 domain-containing protein [Arenibacter algicola]GBF18163.1 hypothetical protein C21_00320 [Arenibacter sp. NBRC 103722]|tara:strand:+ start:136617 stop:137444 length:828 start_codon:yes stop_codon:yes gene_type:complete